MPKNGLLSVSLAAMLAFDVGGLAYHVVGRNAEDHLAVGILTVGAVALASMLGNLKK